MEIVEDSVIFVAINLLTGVLGMPLTAWLKAKWGLKDTKAFLLAAAVAAVLAIADQALAGALSLETVTLETFYEVFGSIFLVSQTFYRLFTEYEKSGGLG